LSGENHNQLWVQVGCAHGFLVLCDSADFLYKTTHNYAAQDEQCIRWDDPELKIDWQLGEIAPQLSAKDQQGQVLRNVPNYP